MPVFHCFLKLRLIFQFEWIIYWIIFWPHSTCCIQGHLSHKVNFYPSDNDFTQALLVMLVTNMISVHNTMRHFIIENGKIKTFCYSKWQKIYISYLKISKNTFVIENGKEYTFGNCKWRRMDISDLFYIPDLIYIYVSDSSPSSTSHL